MKIVIANSKGGAGKSVTSIMLSEISKRLGLKTLLIDAGYQRHSTLHFLKDHPGIDKYNLLTALLDKETMRKSIYRVHDNLDVIPATVRLADFSEYFNIDRKDLIFTAMLAKEIDKYDVCIFDTESSLSPLTRNSLIIADILIIPIWDRGSVDEAVKLMTIMDDLAGAYTKYMHVQKTFILPVMQRTFNFDMKKILNYAKESISADLFLRPVKFHRDIFLGNDYTMGPAFNDYKKSLEVVLNG